MVFNLSKELILAHKSMKLGNQTIWKYLLTLEDGTTFNIMGGAGIPNSKDEYSREDHQAALFYKTADDVKKLHKLQEDSNVLLNGRKMSLKKVYGFIGVDYLIRPLKKSIDDSEEIDDLIRHRYRNR